MAENFCSRTQRLCSPALARGGGHVAAGPRVGLGGDGHGALEQLRVRGEHAAHDLLRLAAAVRQRGVDLRVACVQGRGALSYLI